MEKTSDLLAHLAETVMLDYGLKPDLPEKARQQAAEVRTPLFPSERCEDLRHLLWCSIDNEESKDLDQLTYGEWVEENRTLLWVAIADVAAIIPKDSPVDLYAQWNTTSVYTPAKTFSMLPEELMLNQTSLLEHVDRLALIVKMEINSEGEVVNSSIFQAIVRNQAKLNYHEVGNWLDGSGQVPLKVRAIEGLEGALKCQGQAAEVLRLKRFKQGSLMLEPLTAESKVRKNNTIILETSMPNGARELIEEVMIAANQTMALHIKKAGLPILSRVVQRPKRWERIVEIAAELHETLPHDPDPHALSLFLTKRKKVDPESFPDLSLAVIKLLGRGEYIVRKSSEEPIGHFGLAIQNYMHSTAPNRRFPDLMIQRQYKAYINHEPSPYTLKELEWLARHCTQQEDAALKVERHLNKSAAAIVLSSKIGNLFKGIVTGAGEKGSWVRIFDPPIEGRLVQGPEPVDVGDKLTVRLVHIDIPKGHIDFSYSAKGG